MTLFADPPPMHGLRLPDGTIIEEPPADASPQQWLDFGAVLGAYVSSVLSYGYSAATVGRIGLAYLQKWDSQS